MANVKTRGVDGVFQKADAGWFEGWANFYLKRSWKFFISTHLHRTRDRALVSKWFCGGYENGFITLSKMSHKTWLRKLWYPLHGCFSTICNFQDFLKNTYSISKFFSMWMLFENFRNAFFFTFNSNFLLNKWSPCGQKSKQIFNSVHSEILNRLRPEQSTQTKVQICRIEDSLFSQSQILKVASDNLSSRLHSFHQNWAVIAKMFPKSFYSKFTPFFSQVFHDTIRCTTESKWWFWHFFSPITHQI